MAAQEGSAETPAVLTPYAVAPASGEIVVDGVLDESAWESALTLPLRFETRPGENIDPPVETECLLTYTESAVYVAFRARDPDPDAIRARLTDRDSAWTDDFVGVVFDTFNDERRGFEFFANPLGVQMDLFYDDIGGNESSSWDAIWNSAGKITNDGYVVEMAIPFNQLRFELHRGEQVWGFDAIRFYPRNQRHRIALQPMDRDIDCYLCQVSKVEGFAGISPGRNMEFVPTLVSGRTDERADFPTGDFVEGGVENDLGLTARWGVTPNVILNAAVNPDFSQVEADVAQLDVNEQFALFFPERRPFFLEGADFFDTPLDAVFTRNVADPDWGFKVSGKQGKNALGAFIARDTLANLIFPGSEGSDSESFDFASNDAALRYRRDFGSSSAIGVLFTGREGGGYSNYVGGFDGKYRFRETDSIRFQLLRSETQYPGFIAHDFDQPTGSFSDDALRLRYNHDSRNLFVYLQYVDIGSDFRADMGFMPRVGTTFMLGGFERSWWADEGKKWTRFSVGGDWDLLEDEAGNDLEREVEGRIEFSGPRQSFLFAGYGTRNRFFDGTSFPDQEFTSTYFEIQPTGSFFFGFFGFKGDAIDFAHTREGRNILLEPSFRFNLGLHLKINLDHARQEFDVPGGRLFTADLTQLRVVYQFNVRTFFRTILQYRTLDRTPELYDDPVDPESESLFSQLLFSYKINPQTVLFVGYSDNRSGDQTVGLTQEDRSIFLKFGYAWVL
ncbi:MAG: DUF5916 domain-containing protein [Thermoanaerobaculia bacterium]